MTAHDLLPFLGLFGFVGAVLLIVKWAEANERWKKRQVELGNFTPDGKPTEQLLTSVRGSRRRSSE